MTRETGVCILCGHLYDGPGSDEEAAGHLASSHGLARNDEGLLYPLPPGERPEQAATGGSLR